VGIKTTVAGYSPAICLAILVFVLATISIIRADHLIADGGPSHFAVGSKFVLLQFSQLGTQAKQVALQTGLESAHQAVNTLIMAVALITIIAVGVVVYLNANLVRAKHKLENQNADLRDTKLLREQFLTSATHELNTPLTVTTALTDVLARNRQGNLTDRQLEQLAAIQRNNRHLQDMVDMMIQTTDTGVDRGMRSENVQYSEFIEGALESIKANLDLQGITIQWSVMTSTDCVNIDSDRITQVVSNLVVNAGQNSLDGAIVFISTERIENNVVTCVRDFGPGIPAADQPHVFSAFYKADTEINRRNRSAGLGLTIVKRIVEDHGGEVRLASDGQQHGTTFCFTLPIAS